MKIDSTLKLFMEKYDDEAISSIDRIASDVGLVSKRSKIKLFNLNEGFENFKEFIEGYTNYKIENINNDKATDHSTICKQTNIFINKLFSESEVLYSELPSFVSTYLKEIKVLTEKVDEWKQSMLESEVDNESIASVNDFVDSFIESLDHHFDPSMNKILWATGYNTRRKLAKTKGSKTLKPVFL